MALLQGGFDSGFHMHDIIRQYCISRCSDLECYLQACPTICPMLPDIFQIELIQRRTSELSYKFQILPNSLKSCPISKDITRSSYTSHLIFMYATPMHFLNLAR